MAIDKKITICAKCNSEYNVTRLMTGSMFKCQKCGELLAVPGPKTGESTMMTRPPEPLAKSPAGTPRPPEIKPAPPAPRPVPAPPTRPEPPPVKPAPQPAPAQPKTYINPKSIPILNPNTATPAKKPEAQIQAKAEPKPSAGSSPETINAASPAVPTSEARGQELRASSGASVSKAQTRFHPEPYISSRPQPRVSTSSSTQTQSLPKPELSAGFIILGVAGTILGLAAGVYYLFIYNPQSVLRSVKTHNTNPRPASTQGSK